MTPIGKYLNFSNFNKIYDYDSIDFNHLPFVEGGYSSEGIGVMKSEIFSMLFGAWKRWPARLFLSSASAPECHGFGHH